MTLLASALEASKLRLRPILMTSFAFIVGLLTAVPGQTADPHWVTVQLVQVRGRNAYGCDTWRIYHPGIICHFPVPAGKSWKKKEEQTMPDLAE